MFSHKDVLPSGRILVFMITLGKTFFYLSVSTFIIASISLAELFADPQPVDNAKDAVIAQVCDQIRDLPLESIERINVIVRNVLAIEQ